MRKSGIGKRVNRGFTLIEILIVIVIIGITVGFAVIAYGDFGAGRRLQFAAEHLVNTLKLAQQQAILEHSTLGLRIDNSGYQILKFYTVRSQWAPISNKGIFKQTSFPQHTVIRLKTNVKTPLGAPPILIHSTGDMTPFTLSLGTSQNEALNTITATHNGMIKLDEVKKK